MELKDSINFVKKAIKNKEDHFFIKDGKIFASNDIFALYSPINLDLDINPQAELFLKAIETCGDTISMHITDKNKLSIKSGNFKAFINCTTKEFVGFYPQSNKQYFYLPDSFLNICKKLYPFIADEDSRIWMNGILFHNQSVFATNGIILIEHWIPNSFNVKINIPKKTIKELIAINEEIEKIEVNKTDEITFYFSNNKYLISKLLNSDWPDLSKILNKENKNCLEILPDFFKTIKALIPFTDELYSISFSNTSIFTNKASFDFGLNSGKGKYNINEFLKLENVATSIDISVYPEPCLWFGENCRGAIIGLKERI